MKILQINSDYGRGSTGKITQCIHHYLLENNYESYVFYGRYFGNEDKNTKSFITKTQSKFQHFLCIINGNPYSQCSLSTKRIISDIKKIKPDIVHLQCINGYFVNVYELLRWLAINKINTVLTLHAEFMYTGGCDHAFECDGWLHKCNCNCPAVKKRFLFFKNNPQKIYSLFMNSFSLFDENKIKISSVSQWLMSRAIRSPIVNRFYHTTILNCVDTSVFKYKLLNDSYKKNLVGNNSKMILYVTAGFFPNIIDNKGSKYILELSKSLEKNKINAKIVIVSSHSDDKLILPENVIFLGKILDQNKLSILYSIADVTLIVSKRETFSMPVAESLCCGTPVCGFLSGGPESIAINEYSYFVEYGNVNKLLETIINVFNLNLDRERISSDAQKKYSIERMCQQYIELYDTFIQK